MNKYYLPPHLHQKIFSHAELVRKLYKEALKDLKSWCAHDIFEYRYRAVILRDRFDKNKDIKDFAEAKRILNEGFEELKTRKNHSPVEYLHCPGGIAYQREDFYPDYLMDFWHPDEKAMYPDYFARRDKRKQEYLDRWNKKYGKPDDNDHH